MTIEHKLPGIDVVVLKIEKFMKGLAALPFKFTLRYLFENLSKTGRTKKQVLSFAIDGFLVAFSIWAAFSLRLGLPYQDLGNIAYLMLVLPPVTVLIFAGLGVYRWVVRASSRREFEQILKGVMASSSILLFILYLVPVTFAPRSIFVIYGLLLVLMAIGLRLVWARIQNTGTELNGRPVAIYGAGSAGRQLVSLMRLSSEYHPEVFFDDSNALNGTSVAGLPVIRPRDNLANAFLKKYAVEEIIVAMPSVQGGAYSKVLSNVERFNLPVKTIPSLTEIVSGKSLTDEIREIKLEDLLGREPVEPDNLLLKKNIAGKRVLVTGAGGSIGSELCRQVFELQPECLIMLDNAEPSLYAIDHELRGSINSTHHSEKLYTCLGSVLDRSRLDQLFNRFKPHTVYHAAAYKHVPLVEKNPFEGVKTNVLGTRNLVRASEKHGASTFVMISTDKAVRPTNIMGASKRVAEQIVQGRASIPGQTMTLSMVRFGNVLGSSGSVIPLFKKQISNGGPVTVTHPEMTRYFMLIPEAVSLVIQSGSMAKGGEVFLLDMGSPVRILDLAKALITLHGLKFVEKRKSDVQTGEINKNEVEIKFTGIRDGEKLYEELLIDSSTSKTEHPFINKARESHIDSEIFENTYLAKIESVIESGDELGLKEILKELVSGYANESNLTHSIVYSNRVSTANNSHVNSEELAI